MEENLVRSSLDFLKVLERFTLESKLLACQKYSSRIMTCSQVDMVKAYEENIMPRQSSVPKQKRMMQAVRMSRSSFLWKECRQCRKKEPSR